MMMPLVLAAMLSTEAVDVQQAALRHFISANFYQLEHGKVFCLGELGTKHSLGMRPPTEADDPGRKLLDRFTLPGPRVQPISHCVFPVSDAGKSPFQIIDRLTGQPGVIVRVGNPTFTDAEKATVFLEYVVHLSSAKGGRARMKKIWGDWMIVGWTDEWIS